LGRYYSITRKFKIIGEASKYLLKENILPQEHRAIVDFRNVIVHKYFGIDSQEVYGIIHNDLKEFNQMIVKTIEGIEGD
jgi:uncharacterized protein with HEPN domain